MKTIYSIGLAALVTLASQSLDVARIVHAENQTWTGTISSSNCGGNHTPGLSAPNARSSASNTEQHRARLERQVVQGRQSDRQAVESQRW